MSTLQNILVTTSPASLNLYAHMNALFLYKCGQSDFGHDHSNYPVANYQNFWIQVLIPTVIVTWTQNFVLTITKVLEQEF
jgi:hypothetical protein